MLPRTLAGRVALGTFAIVAVAHLVGQRTGARGLADVTQWFLMPALGLVVLLETRRPRGRLTALVLVALAWSWLGDTAPDAFTGDLAFLVMVGCFLVAQVVYVAAFWPFRRGSVLAVRRGWLAGYAALVAGVLAACAPHAGPLLVPVVVYALCIGAMAVLATGLGPWVTAGALLFVVSDAVIALGAFAPWWALPQQGFWVMLTYAAGQLLIVLGVLRGGHPAVDAVAGIGSSSFPAWGVRPMPRAGPGTVGPHRFGTMSGGVRVDAAALTGVAESLDTQQGILNDPGVDVSAPDAGRSSDELTSALTALTESVAELAAGVGTIAGNVRNALEDYAAWDAGSAAGVPS